MNLNTAFQTAGCKKTRLPEKAGRQAWISIDFSGSGLVFNHIFKDVYTAAGLSHQEKFAFPHRTEQHRR